MLSFRPLELEDKQVIDSYFEKEHSRKCAHSFNTIYLWQGHYNTNFCIENDTMFIRSVSDGVPSYHLPIGSGELAESMEHILEDTRAFSEPPRIVGMRREDTERLEAAMPGRFRFTERRDSAEYIYLASSLASLAGKKLHSKRNFINRFTQAFAGRYEYLTYRGGMKGEVLQFHKKWCEQNNCKLSASLRDEKCVIHLALDHFDVLGLTGGVLKLDGEIIAFTFGSRLGEDTFDVHVEKADGEIPGAYPMINNCFVKNECMQYRYINREEDMGLEGLRRAKLSYQPEILLEDYVGELTAWK